MLRGLRRATIEVVTFLVGLWEVSDPFSLQDDLRVVISSVWLLVAGYALIYIVIRAFFFEHEELPSEQRFNQARAVGRNKGRKKRK